MLLLFIFLICLEKIFEIHPYKNNIDFIIIFLIFFSQSLIGGIIYLYYYPRKKKFEQLSQGITLSNSNLSSSFLILKQNEIKINKTKKIVLIIFASFFNFIGCIIRSADILNFGKREENNSYLEVRIRGIQIIISSLLCFSSSPKYKVLSMLICIISWHF